MTWQNLCLVPDVFGEEAVLGSKWLSWKLNFVVPLPIFGGFQKNVLLSLFLSLMRWWWPLVRIRRVGSWDFVRLSMSDFNINIHGLGKGLPNAAPPSWAKSGPASPPLSPDPLASEHEGAVPGQGQQRAVPAHRVDSLGPNPIASASESPWAFSSKPGLLSSRCSGRSLLMRLLSPLQPAQFHARSNLKK